MSGVGVEGRCFGTAETLGKDNVERDPQQRRCLEDFLGRNDWGFETGEPKGLRTVECEWEVGLSVWGVFLSGPCQIFLSGP